MHTRRVRTVLAGGEIDRHDLLRAAYDAFAVEQAEHEVAIVARRAHDDAEGVRRAVGEHDFDAERRFDRDQIVIDARVVAVDAADRGDDRALRHRRRACRRRIHASTIKLTPIHATRTATMSPMTTGCHQTSTANAISSAPKNTSGASS